MEYKNIFEIEFIQRTQEIVNGYQIPFENTLFINACVGLLIIPQQSLFNHLPTEVVSADKWGIADTDISCIKEPNKSVKNVARISEMPLHMMESDSGAITEKTLHILKSQIGKTKDTKQKHLRR